MTTWWTVLYVSAGFGLCSFFLWVFASKDAQANLQYYVTLGAWLIFLYELLRLRFAWLTLPQPYRTHQYRLEHVWIIIYGWEACKYVLKKVLANVQGDSD